MFALIFTLAVSQTKRLSQETYIPACNNNCVLFPFQFIHDGYVVLDDFVSAKEVEELREAGDELIQNIPNETHKAVFSTTDTQQVVNCM
jgi:hypothetical protein